ncbi:storkhead-box protein 2 isoform X2 [Oncorhynchus mykiss]|uniref:Winged helix Storkhead-box1 domain-containing protein n=1 Tax=Oncorhynchus mykiss TaxID=8022 RepID=A0A8C7ULR8_ONCMY|nr:storkhead-box protein 2 isoform X2 [Oncorhynchus mykiss]
MKKTQSTTLRRAWPSSDFSDRASERTRSRSEKDYRLHKHYPPQYICQSPRGYMTSGDVSPISMSPISQSQFIPLGEVLCLAISAMNSARKPVTQEALTEHLATCFPGVPTPTAEILHHTLSMLVRERKIYPTPEGYFIVTPQTYFITPSLIRTSSKWYHLDERIPDRQQQQQQQQQQCTSPLSGTITPSTSGCVRDRSHPKNHGDSYNSYRDDPPSHHTTLTRKSPKEHREAYSPHSPHSPHTPTQTQPQPTSTEKTRSTLSFPFKSDTLTKHREGGSSGEKQSKKFGLKLFRLSFKKDKTKQLTTFSAQFPPEEWPLRDEETPTAVPRDVEMEIIRRINPDLTVENVARHTAVMKRLEEERAQRSKASSSAQHSARSRRSRGHRKPQGKPSRSHSKTRASRGDPSEGSNLDLGAERDYRAYSSSLARSPRDTSFSMERSRARHLAHSNPNIMESHLPITPEWDVSGELAKRRTEMPFPEPSHGPSHSKVHRSHSHTQERKSRNERSDNKAKERSRSMDNSKGPLGAGQIGPPDYFERSPDERDRDRSRYYTDDGTLRASAQASQYSHSRATPPAAKLTSDPCGPDGGRTLENNKSRDRLPAYDSQKAYSPKHMAEDYFQCNASTEAVLTTPSPLGKPNHDNLPKVKVGCSSDRQTPHPPEYKEDTTKGQNGVSLPMPCQMPEPLPNGRSVQHHNTNSGSMDRRKDIFSKDTLFKPPPNTLPSGYGDGSYSRSSTLRKTPVMSSAEVLDSQEHFEQPGPLLAVPRPPSSGPSGMEQAGSGPAGEASFDYYNVSDDDELEDAASAKQAEQEPKSPEGCGGVGGGGGGGGGTMQWLLEREKERDLQRRFERNLTFPNPKESDHNNQSQQSAHSARLDSMDSSSVTVDSGFNSPRTRESLASNTSSIVESNRRQNLALSPGHLGIATGNGPPFTFRTIPEPPPTTQPEKLQKPSNCLASITSV